MRRSCGSQGSSSCVVYVVGDLCEVPRNHRQRRELSKCLVQYLGHRSFLVIGWDGTNEEGEVEGSVTKEGKGRSNGKGSQRCPYFVKKFSEIHLSRNFSPIL